MLSCIDSEKIIPISRSTTEIFKTGSWSINKPKFEEAISPCREICPVGNDIAKALFKVSQGNFDVALSIFLEENPLPGVCGRVCYNPCETKCNREQWDGSLQIRAIERSVSDYGNAMPTSLTNLGRNHSVAVIGSGPTGLSAAYHLSRLGHPVDLIEAERELGGLLRWGIPEYRLPQRAVERDINRILSLGIHVQTSSYVDATMLKDIKNSHKAVFIAFGAQRSRKLAIPGVKLNGVIPGITFLKNVRRGALKYLSGSIAIIGGGNVAIDVALTAKRLGAKRVGLYCLEQRKEMPSNYREQEEAIEEGITFHTGWGLRKIIGQKGSVTTIELVKCISMLDSEGKFNPLYDDSVTFLQNIDLVIIAIGQESDLHFLKIDSELGESYRKDLLVNPKTMETAIKGLFAGGDMVNGQTSVAEAIASGKKAALAIHSYSLGMDLSEFENKTFLGEGSSFSIHSLFHPRQTWNPKKVVKFKEMESLFWNHCPKETLPRLNVVQRRNNFEEINLSLEQTRVTREAKRCFSCGICTNCERCYLYCPDVCVVLPLGEAEGYQVDLDYCKGCGLCAAVCPRGVITMDKEK